MRDIRPDLRERLAATQLHFNSTTAEYEAKRLALESDYRETVAALERERAAIVQLLALEDSRAVGPSEPAFATPRSPALTMTDFILTKLHAHGPMTKEQLRDEVEAGGYFDETSGRTFHLTLMNISNGGRVTKSPNGLYSFRQSTLFTAGQARRGESTTLM